MSRAGVIVSGVNGNSAVAFVALVLDLVEVVEVVMAPSDGLAAHPGRGPPHTARSLAADAKPRPSTDGVVKERRWCLVSAES